MATGLGHRRTLRPRPYRYQCWGDTPADTGKPTASTDSLLAAGLDVTSYVRQHWDWSATDGTPMDNTYPPEAWRRLGKALEKRRGQLGYGYRQRGNFLRDRNGTLSAKTLARVERGERGDYPDATIAALEALYGYAPGSFAAILSGREPRIADAAPDDATYLGSLTPEERRIVREFVEAIRRSAPDGQPRMRTGHGA